MNIKYTLFLLFSLSFFLPNISISQTITNDKLVIGLIGRSEIDARAIKYLESNIKEVLGASWEVEIPDNYQVSLDDTSQGEMEIFLAFQNDKNLDIILVQDPVLSNRILKVPPVLKKATILFGALFLGDGTSSYIQADGTSGINNLSWLSLAYTFQEDLKRFHDLFPFKKLGVLVDSTMQEIVDYRDPLARFDSIHHTTSYVKNVGRSLPELQDFFNQVDAVYFAPLINIDSISYLNLIDKVNQAKKPSFSARGLLDVQKGVLAGQFTEKNIESIFKRMALDVEAIVRGVNASSLPVRIDFDTDLSINMKTAAEIDWFPPWNILVQSRLIGDYDKHFPKISLDEALYLALTNNPNFKSEQKRLALQHKEVQASVTKILPDLSANSTAVFVDKTTAEGSLGNQAERSLKGSLQLEQLVYNHQAIENIRIQQVLEDAAAANLQAEYLNLIQEVASAYFTILKVNSGTMVRKENLDQTARYLNQAKTNKELGLGNPADEYRWESQYANSVQGLIEIGVQKKSAEYNFLGLLNLGMDNEYRYEELSLNDSLVHIFYNEEFLKFIANPKSTEYLASFFLGYALKNQPSLEVISQNLKALSIVQNASGLGRFIPTIAVSASYNRNFKKGGAGASLPPTPFPIAGAPKDNWNVGLNASIPIFQGNALRIQHRKDKIATYQLEDQKRWAEIQIEQGVRSGILQVVSKASNIKLSGISLESARKSLDLVQESYSVGTVPIIDLLDAQNNYFQAKQAYTTAVYDYLDAIFLFERLIGRFTILHSPEENKVFIQEIAQFIITQNSNP